MTPMLNLPLPPFLNVSDDEYRISGTRIGLFHFVYDYKEGDTAEALHQHYPHVPLATIHNLIAFYLDNRAEVDRFMSEYQTALDRLRAAGHAVDLDALRARLDHLRATGQLPPSRPVDQQAPAA